MPTCMSDTFWQSLCVALFAPSILFCLSLCVLFYHKFSGGWRKIQCFCLQCFDTVGWAAGRASSLWKTEWWGAGVVICLERGADLRTARLMPLPLTVCCFSKIPIDFTFLVPAHPGSLGQRAVKWRCVCVLAFLALSILFCLSLCILFCHELSGGWRKIVARPLMFCVSFNVFGPVQVKR